MSSSIPSTPAPFIGRRQSELRNPGRGPDHRRIALPASVDGKPGEFFTETPQKIFAHLHEVPPHRSQELVLWMSNPDEIDRRVEGTELEAVHRSKDAPGPAAMVYSDRWA